MNVTLKSFAQETHLSNPDEMKNILVFDVNGDGELRLPVPEETVKALLKAIYVDNVQPAKTTNEESVDFKAVEEAEEEVEEEDEEGAEMFGGDAPDSEDDIPSL